MRFDSAIACSQALSREFRHVPHPLSRDMHHAALNVQHCRNTARMAATFQIVARRAKLSPRSLQLLPASLRPKCSWYLANKWPKDGDPSAPAPPSPLWSSPFRMSSTDLDCTTSGSSRQRACFRRATESFDGNAARFRPSRSKPGLLAALPHVESKSPWRHVPFACACYPAGGLTRRTGIEAKRRRACLLPREVLMVNFVASSRRLFA